MAHRRIFTTKEEYLQGCPQKGHLLRDTIPGQSIFSRSLSLTRSRASTSLVWIERESGRRHYMCYKAIGAQKPVTMQTSTGISRYDDKRGNFVRLTLYQNLNRRTSRYHQPIERCLRSPKNDHDFDLRFPYIPNISTSSAVMINKDVDGSLGS